MIFLIQILIIGVYSLVAHYMDSKKIKQKLSKIKSMRPKILVFGDIMLDQYVSGKVTRISPEAPVPIMNFKNEKKVLGGAGNVVHNLVNLGAEVSLATIIGNDLEGQCIKELLNKINISSKYIHTSKNIETTKKTRFLSKGSQLMRLDRDSIGFKEQDFSALEEAFFQSLGQFDSIIISDYNKGVCSELITQKIINKAKELKVLTYVDPKGSNWAKYQYTNCISPNKNEVEAELKLKLVHDIDFEKAAKFLIGKFKLKSCLITRGSQGMTYTDTKVTIHQKVGKKEVFDVSGAGDTALACLAASISSGHSIADSLELSTFISAEVVAHVGTTPFNINMFSSDE